MKYLVLVIICIGLLSVTPSTFGFEDQDAFTGWHKLSTPHVELYTDYAPDQAKKVVEDITVFRNVILQLMKGVDKSASQPLSMVLFRNEDLWREDPLSKLAGGYFKFPVYGPLAVIGSSSGRPNLETIYHEYVHYLVDLYVPWRFPLWYNEGMAEFFSTVAIEPDYVYIGAVPASSAKALERDGMLSPARLFAQDQILEEGDKLKRKFYASAWLTAHYFTLGGRNGFTSHYQSNVAFMEKVRNGVAVEDAFSSSFKISFKELNLELKRYARSTEKKGLAINRPTAETPVSVTPLSSAETQIKLATVFGWKEENSLGRRLLLSAAAQKEPFALSIRALHFALDGQFASSLEALNQLPPIAEQTAPMLHNVFRSKMTMAQHLHKKGDVEQANKLRNEAQQALAASLTRPAYMPSMLSNLEYLTRAGKDEEASKAVTALLSEFGNHFQAQLTASRALIGMKRFKEALACMERALFLLPHTQSNNALVAELMEQISALKQRLHSSMQP